MRSDVRRPGELIALVRRPDHFGAKVLSIDDRYARSIPGVVDVVQIPSGVAVLATDMWSAMAGRNVLSITWDTSTAELRSTPEILEEYRRLAEGPGLDAARRGDAAAALAKASQVLEAEFTFPYLAHAPMEPINAIMELRPGGAEIWSGCQTHSADAHFAAKVLGLAPEQVKINTLLGGGSFGRRGDPHRDWTSELAEIAKAIGGRSPVHVVWTREDDIKGGYYRPLTLHRVKVGLDAAGQLSGWQHKVVCQSVFVARRARRRSPRMVSIAAASVGSPIRPTKSRTFRSTSTTPNRRCRSFRGAPWPTVTRLTRSRRRSTSWRAAPERTLSRSAATCSPSTLAILSS